jgi:signal peptidase I
MNYLIASLKKQKQFSLKSQGTSMKPVLQPDDVIYYKKTSFAHCQLNDIIMIKKNHQLFTHRVIYKYYKRSVLYKDRPYLITKGDANLQSDGKIYPHQVIAKVFQVKRKNKIFNPEALYLFQSSLYFREIIKIKTAFEMLRLNFVFLKGLPLHLYFEKKTPQRVYFDCDVLIEKKDSKKAESVLKKFGYKRGKSALSIAQKRLKDKKIEVSYFKNINNFPVVFDLHLEVVFMMTQLGKLEALYPQKLINQLTEDFLREKQQVTIQESNFYLLSSSNLILYLALHFFHHNFRGAFRLEFLHQIIVKDKEKNYLNYDRIIDNIKKYKLENFVYPVFILLKKYYQTPIPHQFFKSIQPKCRDRALPCPYKYIKNNILKTNIFNDEPRIKAGINRFKNLFFLSPNPLWKKVLVFLNPQVIYSIFWTLKRRLSSFLPTQKPAR